MDQRDVDQLLDADIVARVLDGDTQQFGCLVERYQQALYRHAVAMVLDYDVAADMVQDAFVRAYTRLRACRDRQRFRAWLFQVLRNRCLDYLKDTRRQHVRLDDAGPIADTADDPGRLAERRRLREDLSRALMALPPLLREAFVLHYVEALSYEEMADRLDTSVSALKMRALRAREALTAMLREQDVTGLPARSSLSQARSRH